MKLQILSDLHLSVSPMELPQTDADLVILAGDVQRPEAAVQWALGFSQPVLYICGNHEFFGSSIAATTQRVRELCAGTHVHFLDNEVLELGGVRFLGSVLWTDFRINGEGEAEALAKSKSAQFAYDFRKVEYGAPPHVMTPEDTQAMFADNVRWLQEQLAQPFAGSTVVVTHHAPSPGSVHPRFAGSPINGAFVSNVEHLMGGERMQLWVHGHVHDSFDYLVKGTRVLCNPRGYVKEDKAENPQFDPRMVVEVT